MLFVDGGVVVGGGDDVYQPVIQSAWHRVHGGVGTVDGDVLLGELEEDALLGVGDVYGFEAPEDERICILGQWIVLRLDERDAFTQCS